MRLPSPPGYNTEEVGRLLAQTVPIAAQKLQRVIRDAEAGVSGEPLGHGGVQRLRRVASVQRCCRVPVGRLSYQHT